MQTIQPQVKNNTTTKNLLSVLYSSHVEVDGDDRSINVQNESYSLNASFNVSSFDFSCEFYFEGEFPELTTEDEEFIAKYLAETNGSNSSFTSYDYNHFESIIHKS